DDQLASRDVIHGPDAVDEGSLALEVDRLNVVRDTGAMFRGGLDDLDADPRVVHLGIVVFGPAAERLRAQGRELGGQAEAVGGAAAADVAVSGEQVVEGQAGTPLPGRHARPAVER